MKKIDKDKLKLMKNILGLRSEEGEEMLRVACECVQSFEEKNEYYWEDDIDAVETDIAKRVNNWADERQKLAESRDYKAIRAFVQDEWNQNIYKDVAVLWMIKLLNFRSTWKHITE